MDTIYTHETQARNRLFARLQRVGKAATYRCERAIIGLHGGDCSAIRRESAGENKMTNHSTLPESLFEAHKWISAAGEWDNALASPIEYAREATLNAVENDVFDVTETDLLAVIEWRRATP
jgi:hypothetical protein